MNALSLSNRSPRPNGNGAHGFPASPFAPFHSEMDQLLDDVFGGFGFTRGAQSRSLPPVEVQELDTEYRVCLDLPGVEIKDIDLSFHEGVLTLKAERKAPEGDNTRYRTRWAGQIERVISVGTDVDDSRIGATLKNGVLSISLPKKPELQPRRIEVR